jgi:hypothetical protein
LKLLRLQPGFFSRNAGRAVKYTPHIAGVFVAVITGWWANMIPTLVGLNQAGSRVSLAILLVGFALTLLVPTLLRRPHFGAFLFWCELLGASVGFLIGYSAVQASVYQPVQNDFSFNVTAGLSQQDVGTWPASSTPIFQVEVSRTSMGYLVRLGTTGQGAGTVVTWDFSGIFTSLNTSSCIEDRMEMVVHHHVRCYPNQRITFEIPVSDSISSIGERTFTFLLGGGYSERTDHNLAPIPSGELQSSYSIWSDDGWKLKEPMLGSNARYGNLSLDFDPVNTDGEVQIVGIVKQNPGIVTWLNFARDASLIVIGAAVPIQLWERSRRRINGGAVAAASGSA